MPTTHSVLSINMSVSLSDSIKSLSFSTVYRIFQSVSYSEEVMLAGRLSLHLNTIWHLNMRSTLHLHIQGIPTGYIADTTMHVLEQ